MSFSLSPSTQTVAVNTGAIVTITISPAISSAQPFNLWDGGMGGVFSPASVYAGGLGSSFSYSNATPGVYTLHVAPQTGPYPFSGQPEQTVQVVVTGASPPVPPDSFTLTPASNASTPNVATADYVLTLFKAGAPSVAGGGGQAFALTSDDGAGTFSTGASVTVPAGSSSISFTYTTPTLGTATLTATASGSPYAVNVRTATAVISAASSGGSGGTGGFRMGVPQSGRSSAVGLAIESVFGNVPLTAGVGNLNSIGIPATHPLRFFIVEPGGGFPVKPTKEVGNAEIDGDFETHRVTMTGKLYDGKDTFKLDTENGYYPFLGMLGRDVETTLAAGAYKHVMYHSFPGYQPSFTMEEQFGDATSGRLSSGICVPALSIHHAAILMADVTLYAKRQIPNRYPAAGNVDTDYDFTSTAGLLPSQLGGNHTKQVKLTVTPSYIDVAEGNCGNGPLVFANASTGSESGFSNTMVTINDVAYPAKILPGWNIDFTRNIERFMTGGSGYDADTPVASGFNASGRMDVLFTENTFPANTMANCKFAVNMKFVGAQIGSTGFYYTYEIYLPRIKFLDAGVQRDDKAIFTGGAFQCEKDPSLGYSAKVTLINSFTSAALAGLHSSYLGGGLGGWLATA